MAPEWQKNDQPWNGNFISIKDRKIKKYVNGKLIESKDCEVLKLVDEIMERFALKLREVPKVGQVE